MTPRKRHFSHVESATVQINKRSMMRFERPILHVDCTQPPGPVPQLMGILQPPQAITFQLNPCLPSDIVCSNQDQYSSQQTAECQNRVQYPGILHDQYTSTTIPYTINPELLKTCKMGVASLASSYSYISKGKDSFRDFSALPSHLSKGDAQPCVEDIITASIARLYKIRQLLVTEVEAIESTLERTIHM
jgi:hypothetical protein